MEKSLFLSVVFVVLCCMVGCKTISQPVSESPAAENAASVQTASPESVVGTWTVLGIDDVLLQGAELPVITFTKDGVLSATAGCNRMGGNYSYADGVLSIPGSLLMTQMLCDDEELMRREHVLAETLTRTVEVSLMSDGSVLLKGKHSLLISK